MDKLIIMKSEHSITAEVAYMSYFNELEAAVGIYRYLKFLKVESGKNLGGVRSVPGNLVLPF